MLYKHLTNYAIIFTLFCSFGAIAQEKLPQSKFRIKKPEIVMRLPDLPFFDEADQKIYFEQFEGKPLIISFWATWCTPCVAEIPSLDILKRDFRKQNITIIAISEDFNGKDAVRTFYKENGIRSLEVFVDKKNQLFQALSISGLPTTFFVDADGIVKFIIEGSINWNSEDMRQKIVEHIGLEASLPKNSSKNISLNQLVKSIKDEKEGASKDVSEAPANEPKDPVAPEGVVVSEPRPEENIQNSSMSNTHSEPAEEKKEKRVKQRNN
ncbi:MAG: TlpA disulfide reductase family protein [Rickettsiaceae bacterium]|nr:TlpA disulfide reductase family protein [Rickettsiaceae bacterium]